MLADAVRRYFCGRFQQLVIVRQLPPEGCIARQRAMTTHGHSVLTSHAGPCLSARPAPAQTCMSGGGPDPLLSPRVGPTGSREARAQGFEPVRHYIRVRLDTASTLATVR